MTLMPFAVDYYGCSDIGLVRKNNEDVWMSFPEKHFYLLADGMGGHKAGEVAAKQASERVLHEIQGVMPTSDAHVCSALLKEAILSANAHVFHLSSQNPNWRGMGTTLCCFWLCDQTLVYGHVGDSRIYRYKQTLMPLTKDHSLRQEMLAHLQKNAPSRPLPFKHVLTRAVGTTPHVEPEMGAIDVTDNDIYFLCSDGLTDLLSDEELEQILHTAPSIQKACEECISAARAKGGTDNITILMIQIHDEKKSHLP